MVQSQADKTIKQALVGRQPINFTVFMFRFIFVFILFDVFIVCEARMEFKASCRQRNMAAQIGSVSLEAVPPKDLQSIVTFCDKLVDIG